MDEPSGLTAYSVIIHKVDVVLGELDEVSLYADVDQSADE
jgi:hypothetical protein